MFNIINDIWHEHAVNTTTTSSSSSKQQQGSSSSSSSSRGSSSSSSRGSSSSSRQWRNQSRRTTWATDQQHQCHIECVINLRAGQPGESKGQPGHCPQLPRCSYATGSRDSSSSSSELATHHQWTLWVLSHWGIICLYVPYDVLQTKIVKKWSIILVIKVIKTSHWNSLWALTVSNCWMEVNNKLTAHNALLQLKYWTLFSSKGYNI